MAGAHKLARSIWARVVSGQPYDEAKAFSTAVKAGDLKKGLILNFTSKGVSKFEVLRDDE